jgi:hypothetical protein
MRQNEKEGRQTRDRLEIEGSSGAGCMVFIKRASNAHLIMREAPHMIQ